MRTVVIIGGGIAGLTAAFTLQEQDPGINYILVEKEHRLGGKIRTENEEGFLVEGGPDCFLSEKKSALRLAEKLGLGERLLGTNERFKGTYVYSGNRLHALPEGLMLMVPTKIVPFALSPLISWPGKLRMVLDFVLPRKRAAGDETLESFVRRRLGREALDKIAEPLIGGIHGGDPKTMSLRASFPRFLEMERNYGSLIRAMLAARRHAPQGKALEPGKSPKTYFMTFKDGMEELTAALEKKLSGRIIRDRPAEKIVRAGAGYRVDLKEIGAVSADAVILAVPAPDAALLIDALDGGMSDILRATPMASSAAISLAYRRDEIPVALNSFGFVIPHAEQRKINAVTFTSVKWDYRVPDEKHVLFRTFVGGAKNSHLACAGEDEILQWAKEEFQAILGIRAEPVLSRVHRWIKARPQYTLGHLERLDMVEQRLKNFPGIYLAGGSYRGIGVPDCISDGVKAGQNVLNFLAEQEKNWLSI